MRRNILIILSSLIIAALVIFLSDSSFSRFTSEASNSFLGIAVPIVKSDRESTLNFKLGDLTPGDTQTFSFSVVNYKDNHINDVNMNYIITIIKSGNIPLTIELFKNSNNVSCLNLDLICNSNVLGHTEEQVDNYRLVVTWESTDNSEIYNDLTDYLDVKIEAIQKVD